VKTLPERLIFIGTLLVFLGGFFLVTGRQPANPQVYFFRFGLIAVGGILAVIGLVMKVSAKRDDDREYDDE
jgi:hypothetical protein